MVERLTEKERVVSLHQTSCAEPEEIAIQTSVTPEGVVPGSETAPQVYVLIRVDSALFEKGGRAGGVPGKEIANEGA